MKPTVEVVIQRTEELAQPVLSENGLDLVEVQFRRERSGWVLRLYIDLSLMSTAGPTDQRAASGVTLNDCQIVSREIGRLLDVAEIISWPYTLEVSSPGLDRPLKKPSDFARYAGRIIQVRLVGPEGRRTIKGRLLGLNADQLRLEMDGQVTQIPLAQAQRVQLVPEVNWPRA